MKGALYATLYFLVVLVGDFVFTWLLYQLLHLIFPGLPNLDFWGYFGLTVVLAILLLAFKGAKD